MRWLAVFIWSERVEERDMGVNVASVCHDREGDMELVEEKEELDISEEVEIFFSLSRSFSSCCFKPFNMSSASSSW